MVLEVCLVVAVAPGGVLERVSADRRPESGDRIPRRPRPRRSRPRSPPGSARPPSARRAAPGRLSGCRPCRRRRPRAGRRARCASMRRRRSRRRSSSSPACAASSERGLTPDAITITSASMRRSPATTVAASPAGLDPVDRGAERQRNAGLPEPLANDRGGLDRRGGRRWARARRTRARRGDRASAATRRSRSRRTQSRSP